MANAREQLLRMLAEKSFRLGKFKLSSGGTSDYYIDCRLTTLDAQGALLTGADRVRRRSQSRGWQADAIGGLTMGADPIVVATSVISAQQGKPVTASGAQGGEDARHRPAHRRLSREAGAGGDRGRRLHHRRFDHPGHRGGARVWL